MLVAIIWFVPFYAWSPTGQLCDQGVFSTFAAYCGSCNQTLDYVCAQFDETPNAQSTHNFSIWCEDYKKTTHEAFGVTYKLGTYLELFFHKELLPSSAAYYVRIVCLSTLALKGLRYPIVPESVVWTNFKYTFQTIPLNLGMPPTPSKV